MPCFARTATSIRFAAAELIVPSHLSSWIIASCSSSSFIFVPSLLGVRMIVGETIAARFLRARRSGVETAAVLPLLVVEVMLPIWLLLGDDSDYVCWVQALQGRQWGAVLAPTHSVSPPQSRGTASFIETPPSIL
jgi:hypothetical protein